MPRGDRTGPWGAGPRTGRALGFCVGHPTPGYMWPGRGMGLGRRMGWGRGFGPGWYAYGPYAASAWDAYPPPLTPEQELQTLKEQAAELARQQDQISKRIKDLEKKA